MKTVVCVQSPAMFQGVVDFAYLHAALVRWYWDRYVRFVVIPTDPVPQLQGVLESLEPTAVLRWNGSADPPWMQKWPTIHYEFGWFPQREHCWFWSDVRDDQRIEDGVAPVEYDATTFQAWREAHLQPRLAAGGHPPKPYVLVVGQVPTDAAMAGQMSMDELCRWALRTFSCPIVYRPHPLYPKPLGLKHRRLKVSNLKKHALYPSLANAERVVGINSTALLEAALVGTRVHAVGAWRWPVPGASNLYTHPNDAVWRPHAAWPWLDTLRRRQVRFDAPDFSDPVTAAALCPW